MIDAHLQNIWALKPASSSTSTPSVFPILPSEWDKLWRELLLHPGTIVSLLCPLIKVNPLMEEKEK